jgi:hypothetical protein
VRRAVCLIIPAVLAIASAHAGPVAPAQAYANLFFLHHSTGANLIEQGDVRGWFDTYNTAHGTEYAFWDHGYNGDGLRNPAGVPLGHSYGIPGDNTDPDGLHTLWTTSNSARDSILANHEVIAFKSCYPACQIETDAELAQYKTWYLAMRNVFDAHPEKIFVVMSPPPLHRLATNTAEADRARAFAVWLKSATYLSGHPNVVCFDLFDNLAHPDDGSSVRNRLRYEYEQSHGSGDSHPNLLANQTVAPVFCQFFVDVTGGGLVSVEGEELPLSPALPVGSPNPFLDATTFRLPASASPRVTIFDVSGRLVRTIAAVGAAGECVWDGRDEAGRALPRGLYLFRADGIAGAGRITKLR